MDCRDLVRLHLPPIHPHFDVSPTGSFFICQRVATLRLQQTTLPCTLNCVMDPLGTLVGTVSTDRLRLLAANFTGSDFACEVARLLYRYRCNYQDHVPTTLRNHWHVPLQIYHCFSQFLPISTELFASPLNFSGLFPFYWTPYPEDRAFHANCDAFASPWNGFSVANPEYDIATMDRAVRWALLSSSNTSAPTACFFFLPDWSYKTRTTYIRWFHDSPNYCRPFLRLPSSAFLGG